MVRCIVGLLNYRSPPHAEGYVDQRQRDKAKERSKAKPCANTPVYRITQQKKLAAELIKKFVREY